MNSFRSSFIIPPVFSAKKENPYSGLSFLKLLFESANSNDQLADVDIAHITLGSSDLGIIEELRRNGPR